jgi:hypothetical protein
MILVSRTTLEFFTLLTFGFAHILPIIATPLPAAASSLSHQTRRLLGRQYVLHPHGGDEGDSPHLKASREAENSDEPKSRSGGVAVVKGGRENALRDSNVSSHGGLRRPDASGPFLGLRSRPRSETHHENELLSNQGPVPPSRAPLPPPSDLDSNRMPIPSSPGPRSTTAHMRAKHHADHANANIKNVKGKPSRKGHTKSGTSKKSKSRKSA